MLVKATPRKVGERLTWLKGTKEEIADWRKMKEIHEHICQQILPNLFVNKQIEKG